MRLTGALLRGLDNRSILTLPLANDRKSSTAPAMIPVVRSSSLLPCRSRVVWPTRFTVTLSRRPPWNWRSEMAFGGPRRSVNTPCHPLSGVLELFCKALTMNVRGLHNVRRLGNSKTGLYGWLSHQPGSFFGNRCLMRILTSTRLSICRTVRDAEARYKPPPPTPPPPPPYLCSWLSRDIATKGT